MKVELSASGTRAAINIAIGHDIARERTLTPDAAQVLYAVRDHIAKALADAEADETFTVKATIELEVAEGTETAAESTTEAFPDGLPQSGSTPRGTTLR